MAERTKIETETELNAIEKAMHLICPLKENTRHDMAAPFIFNGHQYATNGAIMIRIPMGGENSTGTLPPLGAIIRNLEAADWQPWPTGLESHHEEESGCLDCKFSGFVVATIKRCPTCDGKGEQICNLGHEHECESCDGDGKVGQRCKECYGTGRIQTARVTILGSDIDEKYTKLLESIGVDECAKMEELPNSTGNGIMFRGPGFDGAVMELEKP